MVTRMTCVLHTLPRGLFAQSPFQCLTLVFVAMLLPLLAASMKNITEATAQPEGAGGAQSANWQKYKQKVYVKVN